MTALSNPQNYSDHDLLVIIHTRMEGMTQDMKEMKEDLGTKVSLLEKEKLNKSEMAEIKNNADMVHKDQELRIRRLEWMGATAVGGLTLLQLIFKYFIQ